MPNNGSSFSQPEEKEILKTLEKLGGRYDLPQVFRDFLDMAICCFALGSMEKEYLSIAKRYNSEQLKEFAKVLGLLFMYFEKVESWADPLGSIYETIAGKYKRSGLGQFFTPLALCDMIASQMGCELESPKVLDPSCGSSRLLLAYHSAWKKPKANYYGVDCDKICAQMSALNLLFHGMHGFILHANSISLECFSGYEVNWQFNILKVPHVRLMKKSECERILIDSDAAVKEKEKAPEEAQMLLNF